jgi:uncharacterized membrane protein YeaQ/YmgE (transglycosylase-associated protein family)
MSDAAGDAMNTTTDVTGVNLESIVVAVIGAVILIAIVRAFGGSRGGLRRGGNG